jgi:hypothetical protein
MEHMVLIGEMFGLEKTAKKNYYQHLPVGTVPFVAFRYRSAC